MNRAQSLCAIVVLGAFGLHCSDPGQGEVTAGSDVATPETPPGPDGGMGSGEEDCLEDPEFFEKHLWVPVLSPRCLGCHHDEGQAGETSFVLTFGRTEEEMAANFETVARVAQETLGGTSILLLKPTDQHEIPHTGGMPVEPDSAAYRALEEFVLRVTTDVDPCDQGNGVTCEVPWPGYRRIRRLSHWEYDRTLTDLVERPITHGRSFAADTVIDGYDNQEEALVASPLLVEQWFQAAEEIAQTLVTENRQKWFACEPVDRACVETFLHTFGARAFRRPWTEDEITAYGGLFDEIATADGTDPALESLIVAILMSPHFVYRTELGVEDEDGRWVLTPFEVAQELSYLLWGTAPDEALVEAARDGRLQSADDIAAQATRMLDDPRTAERFLAFVQQWIDIDKIAIVARDREEFPEFTDEIRAAMRSDTERFLLEVFDPAKGSLDALLTHPHPPPTDVLAAFYGAPTPEESALRAGLLAQGSLLATYALPTQSSPIHRGKLVREQLLCQPLAPPPPNVEAEAPPLDRSLTTRERFLQHASDPICASCHRLIDPIGFGFEHFDAIGRYRADNHGLPIDASGEIVDSPRSNGDFDGLAELSTQLASSRDVSDCFVDQWTQYAYGLAPRSELECASNALRETFDTSSGDFRSLLLALVRTNHFRYRAAEGTPPQDGFGAAPHDDPDMGLPGDVGPSDMGGMDANPTADVLDMGTPPDVAPPSPSVDVNVSTSSDWIAGYCNDVIVSNPTDGDIDWSIELDIDGTITDHWSSEISGTDGRVRFEGVAWNDVLGAGGQTTFGYCAQR